MDGSKYERDLGSFEACNEVSALGNLRSHWTRRALVLLVAFLLVSSLLPGRAFAAGNYYPGQEVIVDGMVAGDGDVGYMCIAYTNFNAALAALGVSVNDSRLTDDARAKLSNASTGGDFYLFASSFFTRAQLNGNLPSWADDVMLQAFISNWENLASSGPVGPYKDIFYATVSPDLVDSAKRDLQTVLDGGSLGGGGSMDEGDYHLISLKDWAPHEHVGRLDVDYVAVPNDLYTQLSDYAKSHSQDVLARIGGGNVSGNDWNDLQSFIVMTVNPDDVSFNETALGRPYVCGWIRGFNTRLLENRYRIDNVVTLGGKKCVVVSGSTRDTYFPAVIDGLYPIYAYGWDYASMGPTIPPSNWPDTPEVPAPTVPEVPEPSEPDMPSQPVQPSAPALPDFPSNVIAPGTTYETFDIQAILDAMDEHCRHLQSAIYQGFADYFDTYTPWLSQELETVRACIRGESQWQMDVLHTELDDLQDYLWQLAQWLAARMQFDVGGGGYDDSSVVSWLKRIYFKLGGGAVSTRPIDPVVDPGGISDWLDKLFQQLIDALFGVGANVLAQLLEKLQALEEKFPFCIPWDIGAILALMVATPEAPAFDLPCYSLTSEGVQQVGVYEIDLSIFDDYMGPIRSMQTILFAAFLCFKVDWFKSALKMEGLS